MNTGNISGIKPMNTTYDVDATRDRQTPTEPSNLKNFALATTDLLVTGTAIAAGALGGPAAALAVVGVGGAVTTGIASSAGGSGDGTGGGMVGPGVDTMTQAQQMQAAGMASSYQLLALQRQIQDQDRQFSMLSNVMRARHDTSKTAINNIRS